MQDKNPHKNVKPASDIETKSFLADIADHHSSRPSENYDLVLKSQYNTQSQVNAEALRASLLEGFKAVHAIHDASQQSHKKSLNTRLTSLFNKSKPNMTAVHSAAMQEAFAYMHRELTDLLVATGPDRKRLTEATVDQKMDEIIKKGVEKLPTGTLKGPLKQQMENFKAKVQECQPSATQRNRQQNR